MDGYIYFILCLTSGQATAFGVLYRPKSHLPAVGVGRFGGFGAIARWQEPHA
jgi:hypothetical protein